MADLYLLNHSLSYSEDSTVVLQAILTLASSSYVAVVNPTIALSK